MVLEATGIYSQSCLQLASCAVLFFRSPWITKPVNISISIRGYVLDRPGFEVELIIYDFDVTVITGGRIYQSWG